MGPQSRIERGLLRLWVALSVLWIVGTAIATWTELPAETGGFVPANVPANQFDPVEFQAFKTRMETRTVIEHGVKLALIPPVLVLALGVISVWVVRGFRE
jgi:hypothetical protein